MAKAIPDRFKDLNMLQEVQVLDVAFKDDRDAGDDDDSLSSVDRKETRDSGDAAVGGKGSDCALEGLDNGQSGGPPQRRR